MRLLTRIAAIAIIAISGCNDTITNHVKANKPTTEFVLGVRLGQDQSQWERQVSQLVNNGILKPYEREGFTYHRYPFSMKDTLVVVDVLFNGGGHYNHGTLRQIYMDLTTEKDKAVKPGDESPVRLTSDGLQFNKYCPESNFNKIKQYLDDEYGTPVATKGERDEITYQYTGGKEIAYLRRSSFSGPRPGVNTPHYYNATLVIALNNVEQ